MRRTVVEWVLTLAVAGLFVLIFETEIAQPFRVPTSSMEPTLLCAKPGIGCTATFNDRVIVAKIVYRFRDPKRYEIAVFHAPDRARKLCSEGGTYLKLVIGLPGEQVSERSGFFYIDGKKLHEPYLSFYTRDALTKTWPRDGANEYFMMGDNRLGSGHPRAGGAGERRAVIRPVVAKY